MWCFGGMLYIATAWSVKLKAVETSYIHMYTKLKWEGGKK